MSKKLPYPEYLQRGYPPGTRPEKRKIIKCSEEGLWYSNMIGQIITVHYFVTFGAWDTEGRWLWYYDLSAPINTSDKIRIDRTQPINAEVFEEAQIPVFGKAKSFFKRLFSK